MDRRTTLAALGGALPALMLSRSLRAQDEASPITPPVYTLETLQWGTVAKLTSQTALGSTQNQDVIAFAKGEILEQTAVASALTSLVSPPPPPLTPMQQQAIEQVKNAPTGQFDAVYLQTQISGHKTLLEIQDSLLAGYSTPTTDDVHIALIAKAFIENHLYILGQLYQRVG